MGLRIHWRLIFGELAITLWFALGYSHLLPPAGVVHGTEVVRYQHWAFFHVAYSDVFPLYQEHQLAEHAFPYLANAIEYPVLMGLTMWLAAWMPSAMGYFAITAVGLWMSALFSYAWLVQRRPTHVLSYALTPLWLVYGLLNWDVIGIALMIAGIRLFETRRYWGSGIVLAAAVFFKLFPIFCLPFLMLSLWRQRQLVPIIRLAIGFMATAVLINAPFAIRNWGNWSLFFSFNSARAVTGDLWSTEWIHLTSVKTVDLLSLGAVLVAVIWALYLMKRGASPYQSAALVFAVFLMVNKIFSPQYMMWMLAYAALADWPPLSVIILTWTGFLDYVNSLAILYLSLTPASPAYRWYGNQIYPLGLLARYIGVGWAALVGRLYNRTERKPRTPSLPHTHRV